MYKTRKRYNRKEAESILEDKYKGNNCSLDIPGYPTVYGMVDGISIETERGAEIVIIYIHDKRYTVSIECLSECLNLL